MPRKKAQKPRDKRTERSRFIRDLVLRVPRENTLMPHIRVNGFTGAEILEAIEAKAVSCDEHGRWTGRVDAEMRERLHAFAEYSKNENALNTDERSLLYALKTVDLACKGKDVETDRLEWQLVSLTPKWDSFDDPTPHEELENYAKKKQQFWSVYDTYMQNWLFR